MSSDALESALTGLLQNNYLTLAVFTAVGYDYVLTFSNEVEYIWTKPWTSVSTMFILVRYVGFYTLAGKQLPSWPCEDVRISLPYLGTSQRIRSLLNSCQMMYLVNGWAFLFFFNSANFVMILRVWVMYNRSRLTLGILLGLFFLEVISTILAAIVGSFTENLPTNNIQILNFSFCIVSPTPRVWTTVVTVLQITQSGTVCTLAIAQFVRQSLRMYHATKQWQLNQYMSLLVRQGILYFLAIFLFTLMDVLASAGKLGSGLWQLILSVIVEFVPLYALTPRFIMSVRELYARDAKRDGIDTGFGLSTGHGAVGTMVFANVEQNEELEGVEEAPGDIKEVPRVAGTTRGM